MNKTMTLNKYLSSSLNLTIILLKNNFVWIKRNNTTILLRTKML